MKAALLGHVAMVVNGTRRTVPRAQTRGMFALLGLNADRAVSRNAMAEAVWGDAPPTTARAQINSAMSVLRRQLIELGSPDVLVADRFGYRLSIATAAVDALEFDELLRQSRADAAAGRYDLAYERVGTGLALWHGDALADATGWFVDGTRARLADSRLAGWELRADAGLAVGRPAEVAAELAPVVTANPLREQLRIRLMVALTLVGCRVEALQSYREYRRQLAESEGLDPGPEISRLEATILRGELVQAAVPGKGHVGKPAAVAVHDGTGTRPTRARALTESAATPRQLPAATPTFVGRERELALLAAGQAPVRTVHGPPGVGKSTLVVRLAHLLAGQYPDGQLYLDLRGSSPRLAPLTPIEMLGRFLRALGVPDARVPAEVAEAAAMYRSLLAGRRILVMLDNAVDAAQVRDLLPGTPDTTVLITSRRALTALDGAQHLALDVLPGQEAVALLESVVGVQRIGTQPAAVGDVIARCGRLPLALRIAGARLAARPDWTAADLARRLADEWHRLDELGTDDLAVRSCFLASYRLLDPTAARAFRLAGLLRVPELSVEVVAAMLAEPASLAAAVLDRLVVDQLVEPVTGGRFRLHDLLRLYAAECAVAEEPAPERDAALHRALVYYLGTSRRAVWHLLRLDRPLDPELDGPPGTDLVALPTVAAAMSWLGAEWQCALAAADHAVEVTGPGRRYPAQLLRTASHYLMRHADWGQVRRLAHLALGARRADDLTSPAVAYGLLAMAHRQAGEPALARRSIDNATDLWLLVGDLDGQATAWNQAASLCRSEGNYDGALRFFEESLSAARRHGDPGIIALVLLNLASCHTDLGRYDLAAQALRESLSLPGWTDGGMRNIVSLSHLGRLHAYVGDLALAHRYLSRVLRRCGDPGDRMTEIEALLCRSEVARRLSRPDLTISDARRALEVAAEAADAYGQAAALRQLARALDATGQTDQARQNHGQARLFFAQLEQFYDPDVEKFLAGDDPTLPRPRQRR